MVRRKIEIKPLEDRAKRHTTFTKRRDGLIKKIIEFCQLSDSSAMMIAFSRSGNCYALGHPHVDDVLERYEEEHPHQAETSAHETEEPETSAVGGSLHAPPLREVEKRIRDGINSGRWDELLAKRGFGLQELNEMIAKLETTKRMLLLLAAAHQSSAGDSCS